MAKKLQVFGSFSSAGGSDGLSAYEVAKKNGFKGSETEWLESLKGDPGVSGSVGPKGDAGVGITDVTIMEV